MTFFTQAIKDGTIDEKTTMSEKELGNAIIAKVLESNAWQRHRNSHKGAQISTFSQEDFSEIERRAVAMNDSSRIQESFLERQNPSQERRKEQLHEDRPAITYDSNTKNFVVGCNCGKEKFIFNMGTDEVKSAGHELKMKEVGNYNQNVNNSEGNSYERTSRQNSNNNGYNAGPNQQSNGYNSEPRPGYRN